MSINGIFFKLAFPYIHNTITKPYCLRAKSASQPKYSFDRGTRWQASIKNIPNVDLETF